MPTANEVLQTMPPDSFILTRNIGAGGTVAIPTPLKFIQPSTMKKNTKPI